MPDAETVTKVYDIIRATEVFLNMVPAAYEGEVPEGYFELGGPPIST